jgi:hypothetical protein
LQLTFGVKNSEGLTVFFVRHWGVLVFVIGALIIYSARDPAVRAPVLAAAAIEKFAVVVLTFFGPVRRMIGMTAIAITDGVVAILYVAYLAGL